MKNIIKKLAPGFLLNFYYFLLPLIGAFLYGFPSRKLKVIGVTGTKGKSTVVQMCHEIFSQAGLPVASLSSIRFKIKDKEWKNDLKMTMPGRFKIQKFLRQAVDTGCQHAIIEVTSEGIKQRRHAFIDFDAAVFTNLEPEHIESHGSFEKYKKAKGQLFQACKNIHVINGDDNNSEYFMRFPAEKKIVYQFRGERFSANGETFSLSLKLPGVFNLYNAAAAISVGLSQGIDLEVCKRAVEKIENIPGRLEVICRDPISVIVDYAHTPGSLEKVYQTLRTSGVPMICVLGAAGGGRDKWKRPELGKIAAQYCDGIILTNEDPYDENPAQILSEIKSGVSNSQFLISNLYEILDRREAIKKALSLAKTGDTVIITGKGCESWMCVAGGKKIPWDDRQIVREITREVGPRT